MVDLKQVGPRDSEPRPQFLSEQVLHRISKQNVRLVTIVEVCDGVAKRLIGQGPAANETEPEADGGSVFKQIQDALDVREELLDRLERAIEGIEQV